MTFEAHRSCTVERWQDGTQVPAIDQVAEEVPVAMVYNGISHAVMLATPASLEQFGLGFSLTEGILTNRHELYGLEIVQQANGIELQMDIAAERFAQLKQRRRNLAGRTGCGLCGAESLQQVFRASGQVPTGGSISPQALHAAFAKLTDQQSLQRVTGATHAAAWALPDGSLTYVEEDVGRHNALDKLIGTLARQDISTGQGFVLVTSRASYEMVQKSASVGISVLAAVSAPTGLAIDMAERTGLSLVGFARNHSHVIYSHPQRFKSA